MNKEFWENQGKEYKDDIQAVNFDPIEEDLELFILEKLINNDEIICDLGCGNGRTVNILAEKMRNTKFTGIDFAESMIEIANRKREELDLKNVTFYKYDVTSTDLPNKFDLKFDKVLTKRLLINVKGDEKLNVIKNIHSMLHDEGEYIMTECFLEPLERINNIRKNLKLHEIKVKPFNEYLTEGFLEEIEEYFEIKEKHDFGSMYYFISRVFNAYLTEGEPDYHAPINKLSAELIKSGINPIEGYSPEVTFRMKKIN